MNGEKAEKKATDPKKPSVSLPPVTDSDDQPYSAGKGSQPPESPRRWQQRASDWLWRFNEPIIVATLLLFLATCCLWWETGVSVRDARESSEKQLREMQSAGSRTDRQITANENAAKLAQRAWIAPRGIIRDKDQIYEVGQALNIRVIYSNTGKEPAVDIDQRHEQIIVPGECSAASGCAFKTPAEPNCVGLLPISGGAIAFPASTIGENGTGGYEAIIAPEKANNGSISGYPVRITEAVHVKIAIIVARGCFAYMTDGTRHTSAYCYKFDGSRAGYDMSKWEWRPCDVGYFAD